VSKYSLVMNGKLSLRSVLVSGLGVFSDGYNLYSIALVTYSLVEILKLNQLEEGLLVASSLYGAAFSALLFGLLSDIEGRKRMYGFDVLLMTIGAIAQALSTSFPMLVASRFILGMGIGADYVLSPIIVAENVEARRRGMVMILTFAFLWGWGAIVAAFVDQLTQILNLSPDLAWRVVLGAGAIPAASVFYFRRKIAETVFFLARVKPVEKELETLRKEFGLNLKPSIDRSPFMKKLWTSALMIVVGTVLWMLYDMYSSTFAIYGPITIAYNLGMTAITFTYVAQLGAGIPGQIMSMYLVDRVGRKKLIVVGYIGVAFWLAMYSLLLTHPEIFGFNFQVKSVLTAAQSLHGSAAVLAFAFYMLNYFFSALGPASIIGSAMVTPEIVPTKVRGTSQAISVAVDRLFTGLVVNGFPSLVSTLGLAAMLGVYSAVALASALVTIYLLPEMRGKDLEEVNVSSASSS